MMELDKIIEDLPCEHRKYFENYFKNASPELMNSFQVLELPPKTTFLEEGEQVDSVYVLMKGKVYATDYRVYDRVYKHFEFYPIEIFGAMEIITEFDSYATTLMTVEESILLKISRGKFEKFLNEDFNAFRLETVRVLRYLLRQVRKERLNVLLNGNDRVALMLLQMYELEKEEDMEEVCIGRKEFVDTTGLSERTVTRVLKEFEAKNLISRKGWDISVSPEQYQEIKKRKEKIETFF